MTRTRIPSQPVGATVASTYFKWSRLPPLLQGVSLAVALCFSAQALAAFTVNGDGTVTDSETGLIWDRCTWGQVGANCDATGNAVNNYGASTHTWSAALGVAITANTASYKSHNDWRLPNRTELESLVDITRIDPAIDTSAFPNTVLSWYWSSTLYVPAPSGAWGVRFDNGAARASDGGDGGHVRLVRSGQSFDALAISHAVSATVSLSGGGSVSCAPNPVPDGGTTICTATPASGYSFVGWSGACTGTGTCAPSDVTGPLNITANFASVGARAVPALGALGLGLLSGLLGLGGLCVGRRRRRA